jgi:hypothetical protein
MIGEQKWVDGSHRYPTLFVCDECGRRLRLFCAKGDEIGVPRGWRKRGERGVVCDQHRESEALHSALHRLLVAYISDAVHATGCPAQDTHRHDDCACEVRDVIAAAQTALGGES